MFTDMFGTERLKVGLHMHTTISDGRRTPEEAAEIYRKAGYDAVALTDHWAWHPSGELSGLRIISGAEYNIGGSDPCDGGVYHIVALGCTAEPAIDSSMTPEEIAAAIHAAGGIAVLAHPAWSLNDPSRVANETFFDATEIYNTVSGVHSSFRPDSGAFCDLLACRGVTFPMLATDDAHYYDGTDATRSFICAHAPDGDIISAIKRGDFYASQGPEVHLQRDRDRFYVDCTRRKGHLCHEYGMVPRARSARSRYRARRIHRIDRGGSPRPLYPRRGHRCGRQARVEQFHYYMTRASARA